MTKASVLEVHIPWWLSLKISADRLTPEASRSLSVENSISPQVRKLRFPSVNFVTRELLFW